MTIEDLRAQRESAWRAYLAYRNRVDSQDRGEVTFKDHLFNCRRLLANGTHLKPGYRKVVENLHRTSHVLEVAETQGMDAAVLLKLSL